MLKQYDKMKEKIKNLKTQIVHRRFYLFIKQCYCIVWSVEVIQKVKIQNFQGQKRKNNEKKKSKFIKQQEASGLLSSLGIKTPLKKFL